MFVYVVNSIRAKNWGKKHSTFAEMRVKINSLVTNSSTVSDELLLAACQTTGITIIPEPDAETLPVPVIPDLAILKAMETLIDNQKKILADLEAHGRKLDDYRTLVKGERDVNRKFMADVMDKLELYRPVTQGPATGIATP
jgi:hypothetical protein